MGRSRDIGLNHGAGKGDAPRSTSRAYRENLAELHDKYFMPPWVDETFEKVGPNRYRKVYR